MRPVQTIIGWEERIYGMAREEQDGREGQHEDDDNMAVPIEKIARKKGNGRVWEASLMFQPLRYRQGPSHWQQRAVARGL